MMADHVGGESVVLVVDVGRHCPRRGCCRGRTGGCRGHSSHASSWIGRSGTGATTSRQSCSQPEGDGGGENGSATIHERQVHASILVGVDNRTGAETMKVS